MGSDGMTRANISISAIPSAIRKLKRRLDDVERVDLATAMDDSTASASLLCNKVNATIDEVFGNRAADVSDFTIEAKWFLPYWGAATPTREERLEIFKRGQRRTMDVIKAAIERLNEKLADADEDRADNVLRAYERLDLHPEIARTASRLYYDGHYANAVEAAVKALNALVRLRSGLEIDGTSLMEKAFSPGSPILKFNDLSDQSDKDEQKGFMMMFSGAVSGLRNPRAHGFIRDDPERALEFIAFVSLLAKLLDEATS
jgi:uncharacterized protein (TIGR02391 family)